ncbi:MAG: helix-turn-helix domain-containing protein [Bdellovibrionota bacterium]
MSNRSNLQKLLAVNSEVDNIEAKSSNKKLDVIFDSKWMTSEEAANYLRVSVGQLRNLVYAAKVKSYRFGHRLRFLRTDLDSLLKPFF